MEQSVDQIVGEITRLHRSLPTRPDLDYVEAAKSLIRNVEKEEESRLEAISKNTKRSDVPEELFNIVQEMRNKYSHFTSEENKRDALKVVNLENIHHLFDDFVQRASDCVSSTINHTAEASTINTAFENKDSPSSFSYDSPGFIIVSDVAPGCRGPISKDDTYLNGTKQSFFPERSGENSSSANVPDTSTSGRKEEKMNLIKLASLIEVSAKNGVSELNVQGMLLEDVEWLPDSLGKLSSLVVLDLSENRIQLLPEGINGLSSLKKLDLHSNGISHLPESLKDLSNLTHLNLRMNTLSSLPDTIGKLVHLEELDVGFNNISCLPNSIGSLICLKRFYLETNNVEEIPYNIGQCRCLKELRVDYNRLRALPEAVGRISSLEVLMVRYNNIKQLPTTLHSLLLLRELDASFNELDSVPESLCFATSLAKLNIGNNFACLRYLPNNIGRLQFLEELDIRNNQIQFLPDSFRMLSRLVVLHAGENPLEVPPRSVVEVGAQAVVQYMEELVTARDRDNYPARRNRARAWSHMCLFLRPSRRTGFH